MRIYQVDAFTSRPFAGNPAGVCITDAPLPEKLMQDIAMEMNLSETAFPVKQADGTYALRWFTPAAEVDLCGHATLATAHILYQQGYLKQYEDVSFDTKSGRLYATRAKERIILNFPEKVAEPIPAPEGLEQALGCRAVFCGQNKMDVLVEVADEETVRGLRPDITLLSSLPARGVIVTAKANEGSGYDFVSRFFAPNVGVPEDPVTGSAHCCLAPYWGKKLGKTEMNAYQASRRGGEVLVRLRGDRVEIGGQAVTVMVCEMKV